MRLTFRVLPTLLPLALVAAGFAQPAPDATTAIQALLSRQAADWNRGDMDAFAKSYKNSPDILFMGDPPKRGYAAMLERYKTRYPSREAMGILHFSNLTVHPLDAHFATTTGNFHLDRSASGGGNADGYFLLVLEKTSDGWKIVCDDTTATPPAHK
jgi:ketosteroid isomerase-like protein